MVPTPVVPGFHEEWFSPASCEALAALAESVQHLPGRVIEFGCWEGRSTCALANACYPKDVVAVDTWEGSPGEISRKLAERRDVFGQFRANVRHYTRGNVLPYVMDWREYLKDEAGYDQYALAFIDATHSFREVVDHVRALRPRMGAGGVLCGDDAHHPPIRRALDLVFGLENVEQVATLWVYRVPAGEGTATC